MRAKQTQNANRFLMTGKLWVIMVLLCSGPIYAETGFAIRSADTYRSADSYYLNARVDYDLHPEAITILESGLPIRITFELELFKPRRYWLDKTVFEKRYIYILQFDPITERYELTRLDTNTSLSYAGADEAIESLRYLSNLLITQVRNVPEVGTTWAQLRMSLDVRNFPEPMQYLSQYWGDWVRTSQWFEWSLMTDSTTVNESQGAR